MKGGFIMHFSLYRTLLLAVASVFFLTGAVSSSGTQSANQLPAGFAALVPEGAKVSAPGFGKTKGNATVTFYATKKVNNHYITYHFEIHCFADNIWKNLEPYYRKQLEQNVESQRKQFAAGVRHYQGKGSYGKEVYPAEIKTYPWGKGVTQRTDTHRVDEITGKVLPMITTYDCKYFGVTNGSIFKISVGDYEESLEAADQWAARCAAKAEQTSLDNIGN
jgi:hypothetical protein